MADETGAVEETTTNAGTSAKKTSRKIVLTPAQDNVVGTIQYVTEVDSGKFSTELLPLDAEVGDQFLCQADNTIYKVDTKAEGQAKPAVLSRVGAPKVRLVEPWDGVAPAGGEDADLISKYPDASYFATGPIEISPLKDVTLGQTTDKVDPYYVYIDGKGKVVKVKAADLSPRPGSVFFESGTGYDLISNAAIAGVTPAKAGDAPSDIDALFALQGERDVPMIDEYPDDQKIELLKFYNILDADGKLTAQGAVWETRIKVSNATIAAAEVASKDYTHQLTSPTPGGTEVKYTVVDGSVVFYKDPEKGEEGWDGAADAWTKDDLPQFVDFATGTNQSVGFYPGR